MDKMASYCSFNVLLYIYMCVFVFPLLSDRYVNIHQGVVSLQPPSPALLHLGSKGFFSRFCWLAIRGTMSITFELKCFIRPEVK